MTSISCFGIKKGKQKLHLKWISCQHFWVAKTKPIMTSKRKWSSKTRSFTQLFLLHVWGSEQKCTFLLKKDMTRIRCCSFRHQEFQARFQLYSLSSSCMCIYYCTWFYTFEALLVKKFMSILTYPLIEEKCTFHRTVVHTISNALTCPPLSASASLDY